MSADRCGMVAMNPQISPVLGGQPLWRQALIRVGMLEHARFLRRTRSLVLAADDGVNPCHNVGGQLGNDGQRPQVILNLRRQGWGRVGGGTTVHNAGSRCPSAGHRPAKAVAARPRSAALLSCNAGAQCLNETPACLGELGGAGDDGGYVGVARAPGQRQLREQGRCRGWGWGGGQVRVWLRPCCSCTQPGRVGQWRTPWAPGGDYRQRRLRPGGALPQAPAGRLAQAGGVEERLV